MLRYDNLFIGGEWHAPSSAEWLDVFSPTTEEVVGRVPLVTAADVDRAVAAAREAFDTGPWPRMSVGERADHLRAVVRHLMAHQPEVVEAQIDEMGGTRKFTEATAAGIPGFLEQTIGDASALSFIEERDGVVGKVEVTREPLGVVGAVIPWNAPVMVAATKTFPCLLMGCPIVLKPAPESPLSAYHLAAAVEAAGIPRGVVSILPGGAEAGEHLVSHPAIDMVTFTGSTAAGRRIAGICGSNLKPVTLELGGKSAAIFLPGTDHRRYLGALLGNSLRNVGQICISLSRVLVQEDEYDLVAGDLCDLVASMKVGDPHDPDTDFGPVAARRQRDRVEEYIASGSADGAKVALGGGRPSGIDRGWFVEPTVFTEVDNSMRIAQEEIFGPVLSLIRYRSVEDALAIANDSRYGLFGAVFGPTVAEAHAVARRMQTGTCAVNDGPPSGGGGPFGGWKDSGLGKERATEGLAEYLVVKSLAFPAGVAVPA